MYDRPPNVIWGVHSSDGLFPSSEFDQFDQFDQFVPVEQSTMCTIPSVRRRHRLCLFTVTTAASSLNIGKRDFAGLAGLLASQGKRKHRNRLLCSSDHSMEQFMTGPTTVEELGLSFVSPIAFVRDHDNVRFVR
jgi:hypothetical protein